jgi:hypothetical protein
MMATAKKMNSATKGASSHFTVARWPRICRIVQSSRVTSPRRVDDGLSVHGPPYLQLASDATASELGAAVARAAAENRQGAVMADEEVYPRTWQPLLSLAGARTNSEFHTGLTAVKVDVRGSRCRVTELDNRGSGGGFVPLEPPLIVDSPSPDELGQAILDKLGT